MSRKTLLYFALSQSIFSPQIWLALSGDIISSSMAIVLYAHITYISIAMRENLTKKEIGIVNAGVLNMRYCRLMLKGETLPARKITVADAGEIIWIEDELHQRLIKLIGHDFYPPGYHDRPKYDRMLI